MIDPVRQNTKRLKATRGNALVEYLLPGGLITVVAVGALMTLSTNFNADFGMVKSDMLAKNSSASKQAALHALQKQAFQAVASTAPLPGGKPGPGKGSNASSSAVSLDDMSKIIQTSGANGGTETLASTMEAYIQKLKADGTLTPAQLDILTKLANAGHDLAQGEKALQDAVNAGQSSVTYNGQTYSVTDFKEQFGFNNNVGIDAAKTMDASSAMGQTAPFLNLYQQAQASGALSDPNVSSQVNYLSTQIAALSDLAKWNTASDATNLSYGYVTAMQQVGVSSAPPNISDATHGNSGAICGVGTGTDSGTNCN